MIIRCPECESGFQLPDERVTPEGTKLKCSKCDHIFRVRDDGGDVEVFYKDRDHEKNEARTRQEAPNESNPFPHAGMDLEPKKGSAFDDLDADEDEMEAFQSAFAEGDEPGGSEVAETVTEESKPMGGRPVSSQATQPKTTSEKQEEEDVALATSSGGAFGDPADHVDESFGDDGAYFDPDQGKVEASSSGGGSPAAKKGGPAPKGGPAGAPGATPGGPPTGASGPPPTAAQGGGTPKGPPTNASGGGPAGEQAAPTSPDPDPTGGEWDQDDLEPHKIGGGMGQKIVAFLLILSMILMAFGGTIAYLNDGYIDFQAFDEMLEVAFADGEYEPRDEWASNRAETTVVESSEPVEVQGVHAELVSLPGGDALFVVQGTVRNRDDDQIHSIDLRSSIMTLDERTMTETRVPMGGTEVSIGDVRGLRSVGDLDDLIGDDDVVLGPGDVESFTLVFDDPPERVRDGDHFTYRVEIADKERS